MGVFLLVVSGDGFLMAFLTFFCLQENDPTLQGRREKTDVRELQRFYQQYYNKYIQPLQYAADKADR